MISIPMTVQPGKATGQSHYTMAGIQYTVGPTRIRTMEVLELGGPKP